MTAAAAPTRPRKQRRRGTSPHPGVVLVAPAPPRTAWRARFKDPDSGTTKWERLDPLVYTNARSRGEWAVRKAREISRRADALEQGATRMLGISVEDAIKQYFEVRGSRKDVRTRRVYADVAAKLTAWTAVHGIKSIDALDRPALLRFVAHLEAEPRRRAVAGAKRGTFEATTTPRAAATINKEIRAIRTVLAHLRTAGLTARLTSDDIRDAAKQIAAPKTLRGFMRTAEIRTALEAALKHDAVTYAMTREEHKGVAPLGSTPRHPPIAPFALAAILSGARLGELLAFEWGDIHLDERDQIRVRAEVAKTKRERSIELAVSPSLRGLLEAMKPDGASGLVFGLSREEALNAAVRLRRTFGAPASMSWQACRRTCSTFLVCAPGIYGGASHFREAKRLGHSVVVAEQSYAGLEGTIAKDATTIEKAMSIEDLADRVVQAALGRKAVEGAR